MRLRPKAVTQTERVLTVHKQLQLRVRRSAYYMDSHFWRKKSGIRQSNKW
uniref:Uncharacterized protein n=1 Tax=Arundo donax TaxID=35708 RepID=A0A0A8YEU4_ARUDO